MLIEVWLLPKIKKVHKKTHFVIFLIIFFDRRQSLSTAIAYFFWSYNVKTWEGLPEARGSAPYWRRRLSFPLLHKKDFLPPLIARRPDTQCKSLICFGSFVPSLPRRHTESLSMQKRVKAKSGAHWFALPYIVRMRIKGKKSGDGVESLCLLSSERLIGS